jgi:Preprotein translocase subunit SecY
VIAVGVVTSVVVMQRAQRSNTLNYAFRQQGNKVFAAQQSHFPLTINKAGVIQPMFASSLLLFPGSIDQWLGQREGVDGLSEGSLALGSGPPL